MKFDTIKANAKKIYAGALGDWDRLILQRGPGELAKGSYSSMYALLPFILASQEERQEMRDFAEAFQSKPGDWLADSAKKDGKLCAWNRVVLRAREAGLELIDKWDVRRVGKLIELFPEAVPKRLLNRELVCYMADDDDCDWMVEASA